METKKMPMIWREPKDTIFDFNKLKSAENVVTRMFVPVKIDKVLYDLTGETTIGVSGYLFVKGTKIRACWDILGNVLHFEKIGIN